MLAHNVQSRYGFDIILEHLAKSLVFLQIQLINFLIELLQLFLHAQQRRAGVFSKRAIFFWNFNRLVLFD